MLSFIPLLTQDPDLPRVARDALLGIEAAPPAAAEARRRVAATALRAAFDLREEEVAALLGIGRN